MIIFVADYHMQNHAPEPFAKWSRGRFDVRMTRSSGNVA